MTIIRKLLNEEIPELKESIEKILAKNYEVGMLYSYFNRLVNFSMEEILEATSLDKLHEKARIKEEIQKMFEEICKSQKVYQKKWKKEKEMFDGTKIAKGFTPEEVLGSDSLRELQEVAKARLEDRKLLESLVSILPKDAFLGK